MVELNETHDPSRRSWVASANVEGCDFPIQNLPFAMFRRRGSTDAFRAGIAIGDAVLDLSAAAESGAFSGDALRVMRLGTASELNPLMALGPAAWSTLRLSLSRALQEGSVARSQLEPCLTRDLEFSVPARIGDYTDFYTSIHHATNIGKQFRPDNPLLPNYKWVPIGYHGRASSIRASSQSFRRPVGQLRPAGESAPTFGACKQLDYELELGIFVGSGNALGEPIQIAEAEDHIFGLCLLNDWSARDIQAWEYQPLGPFLSKNFATTISPWIVTLEALAPFRVPLAQREPGFEPLPYLDSLRNRKQGAIDVALEVCLQTASMGEQGLGEARVSLTTYAHAYWSAAQIVAHHTVGGCDLQPGDLLGTGTLSGPTIDQAGALIERTAGGREPLVLRDGETRTFLEDGDTVIIRGWCERPGARRIGFGECRGTILPARAVPVATTDPE